MSASVTSCRCRDCRLRLGNFLQRFLQQIEHRPAVTERGSVVEHASGSTSRPALAACQRLIGDRQRAPAAAGFPATRLQRQTGASDGARSVACACAEAAPPLTGRGSARPRRLRRRSPPGFHPHRARTTASGAARSAPPSDRERRIGETDPDASEASRNSPDFWKGALDVAAGQIWIEAGVLRQHLQSPPVAAPAAGCSMRRAAPRLANSGARLPCCVTAVSVAVDNRDALQRRQLRSAPPDDAQKCAARRERRVGRQRDGVEVAPDRAVRALPDDREPDAVRGLRDRKLQVLAGLQRHLGQHIDRQTGDRDPHQIVGKHLQHLGVDHRARLQHEPGRRRARLGRQSREGRID